MTFEFRHLRQLGNRISIPLSTDANGFMGRECPAESCLGYFLVKPGTGLTGPNLPCTCPYCGHQGPNNTFYTREQIEYAKSVALRAVTDAFRQDLKGLEFDHKPRGAFGIGISMKLQPGSPIPIRRYREKTLETGVLCGSCTLEYAVYGSFAFCPDCGVHNSLQILEQNLELTRKQLALAETLDDAALRRHLVEDALENCVSALDGFGRETVKVRAATATDPARAVNVSFQSLKAANEHIRRLFGVELQRAVPPDTWENARRGFLKRHVIAHRGGVVDQAYLDQSLDGQAVLGRKVSLDADEVRLVVDAVLTIGRHLLAALPAPSQSDGSIGLRPGE